MYYHQRGVFTLMHFIHNCLGEGLIYRQVTILPGIIHYPGYIWGMGGIPHIMLEEPEERVTDDAIKLVIDLPGGNYQAEVEVFTLQGRLKAPPPPPPPLPFDPPPP